jgi:hypothetical protein
MCYVLIRKLEILLNFSIFWGILGSFGKFWIVLENVCWMVIFYLQQLNPEKSTLISNFLNMFAKKVRNKVKIQDVRWKFCLNLESIRQRDLLAVPFQDGWQYLVTSSMCQTQLIFISNTFKYVLNSIVRKSPLANMCHLRLF